MDTCLLSSMVIALNDIANSLKENKLDYVIATFSCLSVVATCLMVFYTRKTILVIKEQNEINNLPDLYMSHFSIRHTKGLGFIRLDKLSNAFDLVKDYKVFGLDLINIGNGSAKEVSYRFHFELDKVAKSLLDEKLENDNEIIRGFKFKVQHPVLGYWRLLKKLHRVS